MHVKNNASAAPETKVPRYYQPAPSGGTMLTQERIRQIETVAMRKFKCEMKRLGISKSDLLP